MPRLRRVPAVTLIEVLIVTTILAILIVLSLFYVRAVMPKARDGERKADLKKIANALEQYRSDYGGYPIGLQPSAVGPIGSSCGINTVLEPYLKDVPCDPQGGTTNPYRYQPGLPSFMGRRNVAVVRSYRLLTRLESQSDPVIAEVCPTSPLPAHCGGTVLCVNSGCTDSVSTLRLNYGVSAGMRVDLK